MWLVNMNCPWLYGMGESPSIRATNAVERTDLRGGKVSEAPTQEKAAFFGPMGSRYSMLETADRTGDLLLCRPGRKQLRSLMGALLGETDHPNLAFHMPLMRR